MHSLQTLLPGIKVLERKRFEDARGFFSESYSRRKLAEAGIEADFVQDNHSLSVQRGVVRGMHFQIPPATQGKLVWVIRGAIFDVAVDIRYGSPNYGQHAAIELSAANGLQFWIPEGFAHGFMTLEPNTEVIYKVTDYYSPTHEDGLLWNDPALAIAWPKLTGEPVLSPKDVVLPRLDSFVTPFGMADR